MPGTKGPLGPGLVLQDRDRRLLDALSMLRVVDRDQASRIAGFSSRTRANARLLRLVRHGVLAHRYMGTIGGGRKALYTLGAAAARREHHGAADWRSWAFRLQRVVHQMAVNEVYVACITDRSARIALVTWWPEARLQDTAVKVRPDVRFELAAGSAKIIAFLEVDLGTEPLKIWRSKATRYVQAALLGKLVLAGETAKTRVLVVLPTVRRLESVRRAVSVHTTKLFWFTTFDAIKSEGVSGRIWYRPSGSDMHSILEGVL